MITVVSGLARSGTSMVMRMLEAGGLPCLYDDTIPPDQFNPHGYYEHARVANIWGGDESILDEAEGGAIKVLAWVLPRVSKPERLRVLFMHRPLDEILASWERMHAAPSSQARAAERSESLKFPKMLDDALFWLECERVPTLHLSFDAVRRWPVLWAGHISRFLNLHADLWSMGETVDGSSERPSKR